MKNYGILFSGGIDSTLLIHKYKESIDIAYYIDYGSNLNIKEKQIVINIANKLNIPLKVIDLGFLFRDSNSSIFTQEGLDSINNAIVPFRNTIMLSSVLPDCFFRGVKTLLIGTHYSDSSTFKDCTQSFNKAYNSMLNEADNYKIEISAPLESLTKNQIIQEANTLNIDLSTTWSCYKGGQVPCGVCPNCIIRQKYKI